MQNFKAQVKQEKPVLVKFFATWCGPCQTMDPVVEKVRTHFNNKIDFVSVDTDEQLALTQKYKIRSVPSFLFFKEGEILWRGAGLLTKAEMINILETALQE